MGPSALNIVDPISRAGFSVVQPSWRKLISDCRELESVLLSLTSSSASEFPAHVRALRWLWDPPFGEVEAPSDGVGQTPSTFSTSGITTDPRLEACHPHGGKNA